MSSLKHLEALIAKDERKDKIVFIVSLAIVISLLALVVLIKMSEKEENNPYFLFITLQTSKPLSPIEKIKLKDEINKVLKFQEITAGLLDEVEITKINTDIE